MHRKTRTERTNQEDKEQGFRDCIFPRGGDYLSFIYFQAGQETSDNYECRIWTEFWRGAFYAVFVLTFSEQHNLLPHAELVPGSFSRISLYHSGG